MQMRRQEVLDLRQRRVGGATQLGGAPVLQHASAEDERLELVLAEHERRQVVTLAQRVTDSSRALDRDLAHDQVADIAVDGALADVELFGERTGGDHGASAQPLKNFQTTNGAEHEK